FAGVLAIGAREYGLSAEQANDPETYIREQWPTPWAMMNGYTVRDWTSPSGIRHQARKVAPFLSGSRLDVFRLLYDEWYGGASALSHQRLEAIRIAYFTDDPAAQWYPGRVESMAAVEAILLAACVLAELED